MLRKNNLYRCMAFMSIAICFFLIANSQCGDEDIHALFICTLRDQTQHATLYSDPVADSSQTEVEITWGDQSEFLTSKEYTSGGLIFRDGHTLDALQNYTVMLSSLIGECEGTITVPESIIITSPGQDDTLPLGQDVVCTWTVTQGVDFYHLTYTVNAIDSAGYHIDYFYDEIYTTDTSITIPEDSFDIEGAAYYFFFIAIQGWNGPGPGEEFNMTGKVDGILTAGSALTYMNCYVGTPTVKMLKNDYAIPLKTLCIEDYLEALQ